MERIGADAFWSGGRLLRAAHGFRSPGLAESSEELEINGVHRAKGTAPSAKVLPQNPLRPPDLIIQDELHLISGPLGTLVGLYETAIDRLCTWEVNGKKIRPKVVCSTATIRRANDQVYALFLRNLNIFPPTGLEIGDNFFSLQRKSSEKTPGRKYIGVCAPGRRLKAALIRVYIAFLSSAQVLFEKHGLDADPWMTLVGYFNSLRELGGMKRLVDDDVRTRLRKMADRGLANRTLYTPDTVKELTSRLGSGAIPEILDLLESRFDPVILEQIKTRKSGGGEYVARPLDVLLATNMISVGVDVPRLGLMVVAGQPKTTAEYIQATSRVGRKHPGLVCTVFNWARPRDLSHYETFEHYHSTFWPWSGEVQPHRVELHLPFGRPLPIVVPVAAAEPQAGRVNGRPPWVGIEAENEFGGALHGFVTLWVRVLGATPSNVPFRAPPSEGGTVRLEDGVRPRIAGLPGRRGSRSRRHR